MNSGQLKVVLFANTGMGNNVLAELERNQNVKDILLFTRKERGKFPYYDLNSIQFECKKLGILYIEEHEQNIVFEKCIDFSPDLIICATYNYLLSDIVLNTAKMAVNIHPSLLPDLRGPTPTNWAILLGYSKTGLSIHKLVKGFDKGEVYFREVIDIPDNITDGDLRAKLYELAEKATNTIVNKYCSDTLLLTESSEKTEGSSYYPKAWSNEGKKIIENLNLSSEVIRRAFTPFPGEEYMK